jgi:hypothetical protein
MATAVYKQILIANSDEFRHAKALPVAVSFLAVLGLLVFGAFMLKTPRGVHVALLICGISLLWSAVLYLAHPCDLTLHLLIIASVTAYQLWAALAGVVSAWWSEIVMIALVSFDLMLEDLVVMYLSRRGAGTANSIVNPSSNDSLTETARELYAATAFKRSFGCVSNYVLLGGAAVPLERVGILFMPKWALPVMLVLWTLLAFTEAHKNTLAHDMPLPRVAFKCAPLLYLHPYYWLFVVVFVILNILLVVPSGNFSKKKQPAAQQVV